MIGVVRKQEGRNWNWILMIVVVLYASLTAVVFLRGNNAIGQHFLQALGVPALETPFMDMRGVAAWCEAWGEGKNPALEQTWIHIAGEPLHHNFLMNYSPLVLGLKILGLNQRNAVGWALVTAVIYLVSVWFLCGPCTLRKAFFWVLLICSPLSVMVMERGNLDTLIFGLLMISLWLRRHAASESFMILSASLIKFYPIAALTAPWRDARGKVRFAVIVTLLVFMGFLLLIRSRLVNIGGSLDGQYQSAFGVGVIVELLAHYGVIASEKTHRIVLGLRVLILFGISISFACGLLLQRGSESHSVSRRSIHAYFLTAPLMLLIFVQGFQMDYKWIFFLFMVPAVLELLNSKCKILSFAAKGWITGACAYSYWTFFSDEGSLRNAILKQFVMCATIILSAYISGVLWKKIGTEEHPTNRS